MRKRSIHFTNHFWPITNHSSVEHKTQKSNFNFNLQQLQIQNMSNLCTLSSSSSFIFNNIQPFKFCNVNIFTLCIIFLLLSCKFNYLFNFSQQRIIIAAEIWSSKCAPPPPPFLKRPPLCVSLSFFHSRQISSVSFLFFTHTRTCLFRWVVDQSPSISWLPFLLTLNQMIKLELPIWRLLPFTELF